ncbi:hypothetical protein GS597_06370 [Synechococcales cyanobacterium C]|uniref:Uncharacterized protein n=1 Tax=Petrachloros mirabilis ULC683 TaxID=2781853 RepID=A0A8K1ZXW9_9CYAN|nr:hypothetical protein [Petrachloros mirabilis]NCJ06147.1 hypothetical protein [Petrachloros mirabilis ULC683]
MALSIAQLAEDHCGQAVLNDQDMRNSGLSAAGKRLTDEKRRAAITRLLLHPAG